MQMVCVRVRVRVRVRACKLMYSTVCSSLIVITLKNAETSLTASQTDSALLLYLTYREYGQGPNSSNVVRTYSQDHGMCCVIDKINSK